MKLLVFLTFAFHFSSYAVEKSICQSRDNVLANGLVGTWVLDKDLSTRLLKPEKLTVTDRELRFTEDSSVVSHQDFSFIEKEIGCVGLSGNLVVRYTENGKEIEIKSPFVVAVTKEGTPAIWFYERPGKDNDVNAALSMLAKGQTDASDILFIGGDYNNQAMTAYVRKK